MTYSNIITAFEPKLLDIAGVDMLISATDSANFLIYGEIHGIKENADIIYTLAHRLGIQRIAVEASPTIKKFIDLAARGVYDFSQIDKDIFDSSIVSIEVAKTLAVLIQEGAVQEIAYIDTYFDSVNPDNMDNPDSPQKREQDLADNILALNQSMKTLCLLGQWHTQPQPLKLDDDGETIHLSALYRVRQKMPNVPFSHNVYRSGKLYNDGKVMDLPLNQELPQAYEVRRKPSGIDYELTVPMATHISLPK